MGNNSLVEYFVRQKLTTLDEINSAHNMLSSIFDGCVSEFSIDSDILHLDDLYKKNNYVAVKDLYIHMSFFELCPANFTELVSVIRKVAYADLYLNKNGDKSRFTKFLYSHDKFDKYLGLDKNYVFRLDQFIGNKTCKTYRHLGTRQGADAYGVHRMHHNIYFLRALAYGPKLEAEPLRCAISGEIVENVTPRLSFKHTKEKQHIFDIHHCLHCGSGSVNKSGPNPSKLLRTFYFYDMTAGQIEEFMGCIIMDSGEHLKYHRSNKYGDIRNWLDLYHSEENKHREIISYLPYVWLSETNYNEFLCWVCKSTDKMSLDNFVTYDEFIQKNTLVSIDLDALDVDLSDYQDLDIEF